MRSTMVMLALGLAGCAASLDFVATRQPPHLPQTRGAERVEVYEEEEVED